VGATLLSPADARPSASQNAGAELVEGVIMRIPRPRRQSFIQSTNVSNLVQLLTLPGFGASVQCLAFSPDSRMLALGADPIKLYRVTDGTLLGSMAFGWPGAEGIVFHPAGNIIVSVSGNAPRFTLWDVNTLARIRDVNLPVGHQPWRVAITPSGETIATGGMDGKIIFWDWKSGNPMPRFTLDAHPTSISSLAFSRDGVHLATGDDNGRLRIWRVGFDLSPEPHADIPTSGLVSGLSFNGGGTTLAASNWDSHLYLIDVGDGNIMATLSEPMSATNLQMFACSYSPKTELVVSCQSSSTLGTSLIEFWDPTSLSLVHSIPFLCDKVLFSNNGILLAVIQNSPGSADIPTIWGIP
jgi:WD40 repeat protein